VSHVRKDRVVHSLEVTASGRNERPHARTPFPLFLADLRCGHHLCCFWESFCFPLSILPCSLFRSCSLQIETKADLDREANPLCYYHMYARQELKRRKADEWQKGIKERKRPLIINQSTRPAHRIYKQSFPLIQLRAYYDSFLSLESDDEASCDGRIGTANKPHSTFSSLWLNDHASRTNASS
jgi:hypothetical protein